MEYGLRNVYFLYRTNSVSVKGVADLFDLLEALIKEKTTYGRKENYNIMSLIKKYLEVSNITSEPISFYYRSSHQRCSVKKGVLRNFAKFTGKHLCQSLVFNKVTVYLWINNLKCYKVCFYCISKSSSTKIY